MTVNSGLSENIEFVDENGDSIQNLFGSYNSASFIIDESTRREGTIGNDGKPTEISDGPVENRASITCKPETLEILKIMGSYDSNAGTVTFDKFLPKHQELNGQHTANKRFNFQDFKVGGFTLTSEIDGTVTIEFSPIHAEKGQIQDQTVDLSAVKGSPLQWVDTTVKINGSQFGITESVNSELNRNINPEYGLGQGREPAEITEGQYNINLSFVVKVQDSSAWEELLDQTTYPLTVQDERSPISELSIDFGDGQGELVITNGKAEINTFDMDEEKDTRTVELSFEAEDIEVRNL
jgi:hypothetical protein